MRRIDFFLNRCQAQSLLLVGVGGGARGMPWMNIIERGIVTKWEGVVTSGLSFERVLGSTHVVADGRALPFRSESFDVVVSNAVVEHVGGEHDQRQFVEEHSRVGRCWMMTTPNRWFPVESHTRTLLRHWMSRWRSTRPEFTRLLGRREFASLLPPGARVHGSFCSPTFMAEFCRHAPPRRRYSEGRDRSRRWKR